jgi:hypothetical protein
MIKFKVEGPYEIEPIREPGGKLIEKSAVEKFWSDEEKAHLAEAVGCYVFGFRSGRGMVPAYRKLSRAICALRRRPPLQPNG